MGQDVCDSESGVLAFMVPPLLVATIKALRLSDAVGIAMDRSLAGFECNLLRLYKPNKLPFATVEVKKLGSTALF
jgi:hypothetical protein